MRKLKTKTIPAIVMLLGGLVTSIVTFVNRYTLKDSLLWILLALIVFLILGYIVRAILNRIELPDDKAVGEDGEVIEKSADEAAENADGTATEKTSTEEKPAAQEKTPEETP